MLLVNGSPLNMDDTSNPYVKEFYDWKNKVLKKYKFPVKLRTHLLPQMNVTGDREPERFRFIPWIALDSKNGMPVEWRYMDKPNNIKTKGEVVGSHLIIDKNNMDKAFFYLEKCPLLKTGHMWIENKAKEAQERLSARASMVDVNWMLLSESSELSRDEEKVREIGMAIGLKKANDKEAYSFYEVKDAILRAVEVGEGSGNPMVNVATFLQIVGTPGMMKRRALIQLAVDKEYIMFDNNRFVIEMNVDGDVRDFVKVNVKEWYRKEDVLMEVLLEDSTKRKMFESMVGASLKVDDLTMASEVKGLHWTELKSRCEELNIPVVGEGRTKEVLQRELIEHLGLQ